MEILASMHVRMCVYMDVSVLIKLVERMTLFALHRVSWIHAYVNTIIDFNAFNHNWHVHISAPTHM